MKRIFLLSGLAFFILFLFSYISRAETKVGETAPAFKATDEENKAVDLKNLRGKWVVLYFYPKDDTPGCTIEAKEFTELYEEFLQNNAQVYGISTDTNESHCDFRDKYELKVPLISDEEHEIMSLYGVDISDGYASRDTIVISPSGEVTKIYRGVKPAGHAKEVLDFIKDNQT
ncbi:MAG TPA: peroxiredoxin [Thermodesulfobacteriota bacterium]|nr:peroxiredoxin [Thermodesulfobacteriota bacterium]